jgi:hypothetical protein
LTDPQPTDPQPTDPQPTDPQLTDPQQISAQDLAQINRAIDQLSSIATGLCQDLGVTLEVSRDSWSWDPLRRTISVSESDLLRYGITYCAGALASEIGRFYIGRHTLFNIDEDEHMARTLLEALDRPRAESWIIERYPGTHPWLREVNTHLPPLPLEIPQFLIFCMAVAQEHRIEQAQLSPSVTNALIATHYSRRAYAATRPRANLTRPTDFELNTHLDALLYQDPSAPPPIHPNARDDVLPLSDAQERADRARYRLQVCPVLTRQDWTPSIVEQRVQLCAIEALSLAQEDIFPVAYELYTQDRNRIIEYLSDRQEHINAALEALDTGAFELFFKHAAIFTHPPADLHEDGPLGVSYIDHPKMKHLDQLAQRLINGLGHHLGLDVGMLTKEQRDVGLMKSVSGAQGLEHASPVARDSMTEPPHVRSPLLTHTPTIDYEQVVTRIRPQIDELIERLEATLLPRVRLRAESGYSSGRRVDLKQLMRYESDPRRAQTLWTRNTVPQRRSVSLLMLIDLSGSMRGQKADAAVLGVCLLCETLTRLKIPFSVQGFQDVLIPLIDFQQPFNRDAQQMIVDLPKEIQGVRPFGNNNPQYNDDGPCLLEAAALLLAQPSQERLLIVVSDGIPEGRRSDKRDLITAIDALRSNPKLRLVALGLGPHTSHVKSLYPRSIDNVATQDFASEIGALIQEIVLSE